MHGSCLEITGSKLDFCLASSLDRSHVTKGLLTDVITSQTLLQGMLLQIKHLKSVKPILLQSCYWWFWHSIEFDGTIASLTAPANICILKVTCMSRDVWLLYHCLILSLHALIIVYVLNMFMGLCEMRLPALPQKSTWRAFHGACTVSNWQILPVK